MNIYTYFEPFGADDPWHNPPSYWQTQMDLWKKTWSRAGWTPVVLGLPNALRCPAFQKINEKVKRLPTVNPPNYELACFRRWCAYAMVGPAWVSDFDLLNFGWAPRPVPERWTCGQSKDHGWMGSVTGGPLPEIISRILRFRPGPSEFFKGRPHVSDISLFDHYPPDVWLGVERTYSQPGWEKAPLVHFAGGLCGDRRLELMTSETTRRIVTNYYNQTQ